MACGPGDPGSNPLIASYRASRPCKLTLSVKGGSGGTAPRLHSKLDLLHKGPSRALISLDLSIRP